MKTPDDIKFNYIYDNSHAHINFIDRLVHCYKQNIYAFGISSQTGKNDNFAQMREAMSIVVGDDNEIIHLGLYTGRGAPLVQGGKDFHADGFIGSNKNNSCPIILIRSKKNDQTTHFIWHLDYQHVVPESKGEIKQHLPVYFNEVSQKYPALSMQEIFEDKNAEILVTNKALLSKDKFKCAVQPNMLPLPTDLNICSSGLESSIRSYSIAYFPYKDFLLLSGEGPGGENYFWAMNDPFGPEKNGFVLSCVKILLILLKAMLMQLKSLSVT